MNRTEFLNQTNATYIQDLDCIRWYYRINKETKSQKPSACTIEVMNYLISLSDSKGIKHFDTGSFEANRSYIANRLFYSERIIGDALNQLEADGLITKDIHKGVGTGIIINWSKISNIQSQWLASKECKIVLTESTKTPKSKIEPINHIGLPF